MSPAAEHAFHTVMALPADDRAVVLAALDEEMLPPDPDPAWSAELARRSAAVDAGLVKCVPGDEVMARLRKKVGLNG